MTVTYNLDELTKESRMGGSGTETAEREIRIIDLGDFDKNKTKISDELWSAAVDIGFFQVSNHGISQNQIDSIFGSSHELFDLPATVKQKYPLKRGLNAGWESLSQVRPSIDVPDQKESYQITRPHMTNLWPNETEVPGFRSAALDFERECWELSMKLLSCFALKLGFDEKFFATAHDPESDSYQSTLRFLHYFALRSGRAGEDIWRAGAHTDFDCLTLLFQRNGQDGLQVCPGREMDGQKWTAISASDSTITCNIGDMLMRWSDDLLPSNFHRVKGVGGEGERYSIAYFAQANREIMISGPSGKYAPITAQDYLSQRMAANYSKK